MGRKDQGDAPMERIEYKNISFDKGRKLIEGDAKTSYHDKESHLSPRFKRIADMIGFCHDFS